jgi:hypothetical protein
VAGRAAASKPAERFTTPESKTWKRNMLSPSRVLIGNTQAEAHMDNQKSTDQASEDFTKSLDRLKEKSKEVKAKIEQEKRRQDLPLDSHLGNPKWEENAADGHLDVPEQDDD